ncbi:MAG TPA: hypothetical protein VKN36_02655 [Eudoraea sp.]|nr:hypothetical protein [Eudoraea sp.]
MRRIKFNAQLNWKYIFGEILLIFIGISLAIWFSNWNSSIASSREKEVAIARIKKEIQSNNKELVAARTMNESILDAFSEFTTIYQDNSREIISSPDHLNELQQKYPDFFRVTDSTELATGLFHYYGSTFINLELAELSQIAWETTRSINITNEFDYECLYALESLYNLQSRVESEIENAARALQKGEINELMRILEFISQYDVQLEEDYKDMLNNIDNCH